MVDAASCWRRLQRPATTVAMVLVCCLLGLVGVGATLDESSIDTPAPEAEVARVVLDIVVGQLACFVLLPVMRLRRPRLADTAALLAVLAGAVSLWATPVLAYAVVRLGSKRDLRWLASTSVVFLMSCCLAARRVEGRGPTAGEWIGAVVLLGALLVVGLYLGSRRALMTSLTQQALTARREQQALAAQSRAEERVAIAREMHDTLSHRLAVISLHAGGLASRSDLDGNAIHEAASLIQSTAQQGNENLHELLVALRSTTHHRALPLTVDDVEHIVDEARTAGGDVTLNMESDVRRRAEELSATSSMAVAMAIKEGLANAYKHAPGAPVTVTLCDDGAGLHVLVANPVGATDAGLSGGHGLVGLEERLRVAGGWLRREETDQLHRLEAWAPWR